MMISSTFQQCGNSFNAGGNNRCCNKLLSVSENFLMDVEVIQRDAVTQILCYRPSGTSVSIQIRLAAISLQPWHERSDIRDDFSYDNRCKHSPLPVTGTLD
ncbi:hypothetical protein GBF38_004417 [Nibea albiflora]|uniref:Uncharacterized protein n=1 Tax=Nibea albiflora TaxID=240163 RepID=A0ACB7FCX2_NIBAL|nr:hypothetical protein GBF38_004417 [Nibea albiflora]